MAQVSERARLGASAARVWKVVGDFGGLVEAILDGGEGRVQVEGDGIGALRTVTVGEQTMVERLEAHDERSWRTSYSMPVTGPFPMTGYRSTIQLTPAGDKRCDLEWTGTFEPVGVAEDVAASAVRRVYVDAIAMLRRRFGS